MDLRIIIDGFYIDYLAPGNVINDRRHDEPPFFSMLANPFAAVLPPPLPLPSSITATQPDFALSNRMIRQRFLIGAKQAQHSEAGKLRLAGCVFFCIFS